ncbi:MAG: hypothetical protein AAFP19_15890 [Bacteroidota bacterium]
MKNYLWLCFMLISALVQGQWIFTPSGIQYTAGQVGIGIGTAGFTARAAVQHTTGLGTISSPGLWVIRESVTGGGTSNDVGIESKFIKYDIGAGMIDLGDKIGILSKGYAESSGFAGTLDENMGVWARAGIFIAASTSKINKCYGLLADYVTYQGTIENAYGVYIKESPGMNGTVNNKFDLYASTSTAKNYLAGRLGIGGLDSEVFVSDYMLVVKGKGLLEEVKVRPNNEWPDYVFEAEYELTSLDSLASYIAEEGHLPGMPSAEEVAAEEGIELGEMNRKLLEKVEELTLYILDQEARLKALEAKLEEASEQE